VETDVAGTELKLFRLDQLMERKAAVRTQYLSLIRRVTQPIEDNAIVAPGVTGGIRLYLLRAGTGMGMSRTGVEYRTVLALHQFPRFESWGIRVNQYSEGAIHDSSIGVDLGLSTEHLQTGVLAGDLPYRTLGDEPNMEDVRELARARPYVEAALREVPALTGNLISDVRTIAGLTTGEVAELVDVPEEVIARWRDSPETLPLEPTRILTAARAIGAILVGSLGPVGVRSWLLAEPDAPLALLKQGRVQDAVRRAEDYRETVAT
jgi:hypothetical protein